METQAIRNRIGHSDLFELIVGGELSCVDDGVPHDVRHNTDPETSDSIGGEDLTVAIDSSVVPPSLFGLGALILQTNLYHISWICH